ncbi:hypothetical protein CDL15_Pgr007335 [Punica granatum]|uniref:Glycosyltransferase 61 catalytic domain-containing protein n=1 Tax=Punica granatum TaxID=22663 RepID=A0A218X8M5_PUNGR|nr:hypothetical protein CDL15_Pgr007335 [Punica granatum]
MREVTPIKILHGESSPPPCDLTHNVTAMIFSSGGFSGNTFHELNEIVIPLFLTSRHFRSQVANVKEIKKPKLMLISWRGTQKILNERVLVQLMEQVGFQVVVADDKTILSLEHFVEIVNSCSVLVRVQGAGLAHELFLPDGSVLVRIVLLGMEWNAETYFGGPGTTMGFRHLEYKISPKESSILQMYSTDHLVITEPESVLAKGFEAARAVDFDKQDVKIDLFRFKKTLVKALKLVGH